MNSCPYTATLIDAEFLDLGLETLFNEPKSESGETILLDPPDKELENLSGEETEEYLEQILDISNNNITHVQHALVSSSNHAYDSPPSSPDSMTAHPGSHYNSYSPFDPVSSSCVHQEPQIICKTEAPWSPSVPSPASPDSSSHFCYPYPWQQNIKYEGFDEEKHSNYLNHSPDTSRCEYPIQPIVPYVECEPTIDDKEDNVKYEEWTIFQHVGPDGRCECKEKKNLSKCLAQKSRRRRTNQLWHFLLEVLNKPEYSQYIRWLDRKAGVFRFEQSQKVAKLWGHRKQKKNMSYEYMSRAMRHYYIQGIMRRVSDKRLTYQFGPNAENWKRYAMLT